MSNATTDAGFWDTYERLSHYGHCDSAGGAEYRRALAEWEAASRPEGTADFIKARAKALPSELEVQVP